MLEVFYSNPDLYDKTLPNPDLRQQNNPPNVPQQSKPAYSEGPHESPVAQRWRHLTTLSLYVTALARLSACSSSGGPTLQQVEGGSGTSGGGDVASRAGGGRGTRGVGGDGGAAEASKEEKNSGAAGTSTSGSSETVEPTAVFDVASLVLYGSRALPLRFKILLDELFYKLIRDRDRINGLLGAFGWTQEDFKRGYILQVSSTPPPPLP